MPTYSSLDALYLSLSLAILILVIFLSMIALEIIRILRQVQAVLEDIVETTHDIQTAKNQFKSKVNSIFNIVTHFLKPVLQHLK